MPATYEIYDSEAEFVVVCRRSRLLAKIIASAVVTAAFCLVAYLFFHNLIVLAVGVLAIGWQVTEIFRSTEVILRITNLELTSEGYFGAGYSPDRAISRADVLRFEYQEERVGGDDYYSPSGLYVQRRWKTSCILPGIDEAQTEAITDAIYKRFPDMPLTEDQPLISLFGDDLIRLDLSGPGV